MKLQIKDAGAWRNMVSFSRSEEVAVLKAAADLLRSLQQPRTVLRVVETDTTLFTCSGPDFVWKPRA
jgi:hypothetical protein